MYTYVDMLLITQLILGGTIIALIILIFFVCSQNIRPLINKVLLVQMLGNLGWVGCIFANLWLKSDSIEQFVFAFAALMLVAQLFFVFLYPGTHEHKPLITHLMSFALGFGLTFIIVSFIPGAVFSAIEVTATGYTIVSPGWFSGSYAGFVFIYIVSAILLLVHKQRTLPSRRLKQQTSYLLAGFIVFFLTNLFTNSILPVAFGIHFFNGVGPVFSLILVAFIVHIIYRYKFLEIQSLIQRGLIFITLLGLVVTIYLTLVTLIGIFAQPTLQITSLSAGAITTIIGIFTVPSIDQYLRRLTHSLFFKGQFDYSETLYDLSQALHQTLSVQKIINITTSKLATIFGANSVSIVIEGQKHIPTNDSALSLTLETSNGKIGELLLGTRQSGDAYTRKDQQMLGTLINQVAIAIERAQLYETVHEYSNELEQKVATRTSELQALQEYQRQMLDDLSHGLKIPITVIMNELELFDIGQQPRLASFKHSVDSLSEFINKLLLLSMLEAPGDSWQFASFNLSAALSEIVEYSEISLQQPGVSFRSNIVPNIYITGDRKKLVEVLHVLLHNAVKYRDPVRPQTISINLTFDRRTVLLRVHDTGIGIAQAHQPHVFKRFYRIRSGSHANAEGSGLGLSIAETIIRKHGGTITVQSEVGRFTEFALRLPNSGKNPF